MMTDTCLDYFEYLKPDVQLYKPAEVPKLEKAIEDIKKFKADIEKERLKRNETRTGLLQCEPGGDAGQKCPAVDEERGPIGDGTGYPDTASCG
jgi:hypothetical protein